MRRRLLLGILLTLVALPAPAGAAVIQDFSGFTTGTNGIALGPDGNFWVSEEFGNSVARMTPAGQITGRWAVGARPTSIAAGPNGTVWVSVTGANQLARFDTTQAAPAPQLIPTNTGGAGCGPVGIADGGNGRMYFTQPGTCGGDSYIGSVDANGAGQVKNTTPNAVFDLAVSGGKLFAPDFFNDRVLRYSLALGAFETAVGVPGSPDGVTVDGQGNVWVSQFGGSGVARFPATQNGGAAQTFGGSVTAPFGIVAAPDGRVYAAGSESGNLVRVSADGTFKSFPAGGKPWDIVAGPDGDLYFTDLDSGRVRRFVSSAPRVGAAGGVATATTSANVSATVDARGNATTVTFEYGPTTAYGSAVTVAASGVGPFPVGATLSGLAAGTTYHARVRAINEEGEAAPSGDFTFTTPAPPPPPPVEKVLKARASFSWGFTGARTVLTRIRITDLEGGETVRITCAGGKKKGCPLKSKTYRNVKAGNRSLTSLFGKKRKLRTGAKIEVRITKAGATGSVATLTIGKRKKDPRIVRRPLKP
ncbi:hypothetical protein DVA67_015370 [Solirubrobacter sp. CPCC 204708]|uniref:Fibronectin type-III domain-containing protein n=1 Tax=Solirubrobacter deserti TaxID=2282478 RepID=A0ABT4RLB9_9ACTN|nr:hypothetical protein [Solirubrobacter deserti]MBE2317361.1 hypothetical protein [Solirubrobacter deserti]MDA0139090.1 hypothetical protein [Solirubrobacter deserti]